MPPVKVFFHDSARAVDAEAFHVPGMEQETILPPANNLTDKGRPMGSGRGAAAVSWLFDTRWRFRMVWIPMVVLGTLLLAWDSFKSATAPWWATWLGNGLLIFGVDSSLFLFI